MSHTKPWFLWPYGKCFNKLGTKIKIVWEISIAILSQISLFSFCNSLIMDFFVAFNIITFFPPQQVLGIEPRDLSMLKTHSSTELCPCPQWLTWLTEKVKHDHNKLTFRFQTLHVIQHLKNPNVNSTFLCSNYIDIGRTFMYFLENLPEEVFLCVLPHPWCFQSLADYSFWNRQSLLGIGPRTLHMLVKPSATEMYSQFRRA